MSGAFVRIGDHAVGSCDLTFSLSGTWEAVAHHVAADAAPDVEGSVTLHVGDRELTGTSTAGQDAVNGIFARIVGGAGGLAKTVSPQGYTASATRKTILDDIANAGGESLSSESDSGILSTAGRWTRTAGTVADALDAVAEAARATWRIRADGKIWIGTDAWSKVEPDHTVLDEDPNRGRLIVRLDELDVLPGDTFLDRQIIEAVYRIDDRKLRAELRYGDGAAGLAELLGDMVRRVNGPVDWSATYIYEVSSQKGDGTLSLRSTDARMPDLDDVPLRVGIAGVTESKIKPKSLVLVTHENGDRTKPAVVGAVLTQAQTLVLDLLEKVEIKAGQTLKVSPSAVECGGSQPLVLNTPLVTWASAVVAAIGSLGGACPALVGSGTTITRGA